MPTRTNSWSRLLLSLALAGATPALARPHLLDPSDLGAMTLADYHPAAPVAPLGRPPPVRGAPVGGRVGVDLFLLGLGLAAGGLVLGAGGFTVLYVCRDGTACHGDVSTGVGWALAAPGILPLGVGLVMMYIASGGRGRAELSAPSSSGQRWAVGFAPVNGGGLLSASTRF